MNQKRNQAKKERKMKKRRKVKSKKKQQAGLKQEISRRRQGRDKRSSTYLFNFCLSNSNSQDFFVDSFLLS